LLESVNSAFFNRAFSLAFEEAAIGYVDAGKRVLALPSFVATYQQRA